MKNKKLIIFISIIITAIALAGFMYLSTTSKKTSYNSGSSSTTAQIPSKISPQKNQSNSSQTANQTNNTSINNSSQTSATLTTPTGNFVSNHNPNSSDPRQLNEISVCYTTPGAYCNIQFNSGNSTISLGEQLVGSSGSVTWNWNINNIGLYQGKWTITAVATLNGQSKKAVDQIPLTIQ